MHRVLAFTSATALGVIAAVVTPLSSVVGIPFMN